MSDPSGPAQAQLLLEQISTHWQLITDPLQFALRYAPAVRRYLAALIENPHDAEDATQNILLQALRQPFRRDQVQRGRFRDYLKAALRNAALTHARRLSRLPGTAADLDHFPAHGADSAADEAWLADWRNCVLQRAWEALEWHERKSPEGLAYTVLRLATDHPDEDSAALAARATAQSGHPLRPEAFRKQLSRARRHFAQFIIDIIRETLVEPRSQDVVDELTELGMMTYVRDFLPETFFGHKSPAQRVLVHDARKSPTWRACVMLVLTRRVGEEIIIAGNIRVTVVAVSGRQIRLGITAPSSVHVARTELLTRDAGHDPPAQAHLLYAKSKRRVKQTAYPDDRHDAQSGP